MFPPDLVRTARLAGGLYFIVILCGIGAEAALRGPLVDLADPAGTAEAIRNAPLRFRAGLAADLAMGLADVGLAIVLYRLFRPVSAALAQAATAFRLVHAAIIGASLLTLQAAALLLDGSGAAALPPEPVSMAMLFLALHASGYDIALAFFGINAFLTGALILRFGWLPRLLGWAVIAAGGVYLAGAFLRVLAPALASGFAPAYAIPVLAESAFCLALLLARRSRDETKGSRR